MPKVFTSQSQKIGEIGEHLAARFLKNKDFIVLERNYTKKWGELDIVAKKENTIHFVEVKSKSVNFSFDNKIDSYKPEDNMHPWKLKRLSRTIETYLAENNVKIEWQFDLVVVYLDLKSNQARINLMENIIL